MSAVMLATANIALHAGVAPAAAPAKKAPAKQKSPYYALLNSKPQPLYKAGENALFTLRVHNDKALLKSGTAVVKVTNSMGDTIKEEVVDLAKKNPAKFYVTLKTPGIAYVYVAEVKDAQGKALKLRNAPRAAAGFDVDKIAAGDTEPADFVQFWQKAVDSAKDAKVDIKPQPGKTYPHHEPFLLTVNMPNGEKVYATMLMPKKRQPNTEKICINIPGAGAGSGSVWVAKNRTSDIIVFMHVHKYVPTVNPKEMRAALKEYQTKIGRKYQYDGVEKPETFFYYRVIAGFSRIADYLTTLPEWDQKNLLVTGSSQGGFLTMALAAVNKKITAISVNVPAMCDHAGWKLGRKAGWPQIHENYPAGDNTARYYDVCNFANHITVPVFMAVGYLDGTAPAVGGYAAYNRIKSHKELLPMFNRSHEITKEYSAQAGEFMQKYIK